MNIIRLSFPAILFFLLPSCASDEALDDRFEHRNARHENRQERRTMRQEAREQRDDAWYDRHMH